MRCTSGATPRRQGNYIIHHDRGGRTCTSVDRHLRLQHSLSQVVRVMPCWRDAIVSEVLSSGPVNQRLPARHETFSARQACSEPDPNQQGWQATCALVQSVSQCWRCIKAKALTGAEQTLCKPTYAHHHQGLTPQQTTASSHSGLCPPTQQWPLHAALAQAPSWLLVALS
jgi:hypothetical protein